MPSYILTGKISLCKPIELQLMLRPVIVAVLGGQTFNAWIWPTRVVEVAILERVPIPPIEVVGLKRIMISINLDAFKGARFHSRRCLADFCCSRRELQVPATFQQRM